MKLTNLMNLLNAKFLLKKIAHWTYGFTVDGYAPVNSIVKPKPPAELPAAAASIVSATPSVKHGSVIPTDAKQLGLAVPAWTLSADPTCGCCICRGRRTMRRAYTASAN